MRYVALLALAAVDAAGYSVIAPVVPAIGAETSAGPGTLGVLVAVFGLGQLVAFPLAGRALHARPARTVLLVSLVLVTLGDLGFVLLDGLAAWFPARFVQGVGAGGLWMGVTFAVLERWPGEEYRRLSGALAAYSVGGVGGYALGAVEGVRGPFVLHLVLAGAGVAAAFALGAVRSRPAFGSDVGAVRSRRFALASAGILLVAIGYGVLDGPLPLHFAEQLTQREIATLLVGASLLLGAAAVVAGRISPRAALWAGTVAVPLGLGAAGAADAVGVWIVAVGVAAIGFGLGEAGALGVLLDGVGPERIVLAMVLWSQVWGVGYLAGPAVAGAVAATVGYGALVLVPLVASALVVACFAAARPAPAPAR